RISGVELVAPVPGNRHVGIARQADQDRWPPVPGNVQQQDRVGALPADVSPGVVLALLLTREPLTAVRAGDEPVRAGPGGGLAGIATVGSLCPAAERLAPGMPPAPYTSSVPYASPWPGAPPGWPYPLRRPGPSSSRNQPAGHSLTWCPPTKS